MLRERRQAIAAVAADFIAAEKAIETAAECAARCVATAIEQRAKANLPLNTGVEALQLIADALNGTLAARAQIIAAHKLLAEIPKELRIPMGYGDTGCPGERAEAGGHLSVVS